MDNLAFTDEEFKLVQSKNEGLLPKLPKMFNGRYQKVKKLGEGSFNWVYVAKDLYQGQKQRLLSAEHCKLIEALPQTNTNPYKRKAQSYFYDSDEEKESEDDIKIKS